MMRSVWMSTVGALLRRIVLLAGSALITFAIENLMGWVQAGFLADPKTAAVWPVVYLLLEAIQKFWREYRKEIGY